MRRVTRSRRVCHRPTIIRRYRATIEAARRDHERLAYLARFGLTPKQCRKCGRASLGKFGIQRGLDYCLAQAS